MLSFNRLTEAVAHLYANPTILRTYNNESIKKCVIGFVVSGTVAALSAVIAGLAIAALLTTPFAALPLIAGIGLTVKISILSASSALLLISATAIVLYNQVIRLIDSGKMFVNSQKINVYDFVPYSDWAEDESGLVWVETSEPSRIKDGATGRVYWNESKSVIRIKSAALALGTLAAHPFLMVIDVAFRIGKLVTFSHFWVMKNGSYDLKARLSEAGGDIARIVLAPMTFIALEISALYGIISPHNGRKLYATFERFQYDDYRLAPCFQPSPQSHFFGGASNVKDAF